MGVVAHFVKHFLLSSAFNLPFDDVHGRFLALQSFQEFVILLRYSFELSSPEISIQATLNRSLSLVDRTPSVGVRGVERLRLHNNVRHPLEQMLVVPVELDLFLH